MLILVGVHRILIEPRLLQRGHPSLELPDKVLVHLVLQKPPHHHAGVPLVHVGQSYAILPAGVRRLPRDGGSNPGVTSHDGILHIDNHYVVAGHHTRGEVRAVLAGHVLCRHVGNVLQLLSFGIQHPPPLPLPRQPLLAHVIVEWQTLGVMLVTA
ncbi:large subunit ribosomal protein L13 [Angomonas deanei]|nr:large subunit ribosomal protein L13 [Angomonas deanei]|eukprot:EPY38319.1 large subunit ribosomal protein L13 [Angomonas deanei]